LELTVLSHVSVEGDEHGVCLFTEGENPLTDAALAPPRVCLEGIQIGDGSGNLIGLNGITGETGGRAIGGFARVQVNEADLVALADQSARDEGARGQGDLPLMGQASCQYSYFHG
jgi:hypothetical protein